LSVASSGGVGSADDGVTDREESCGFSVKDSIADIDRFFSVEEEEI
jgi:hypothetical protein